MHESIHSSIMPEEGGKGNEHTNRYCPTPEQPEVMSRLHALICWIEEEKL